MTGDPDPFPGISTFHFTFSVSLHWVGGVALIATPLPVGPRQCAQFSALRLDELKTTKMISKSILRIMICGPFKTNFHSFGVIWDSPTPETLILLPGVGTSGKFRFRTNSYLSADTYCIRRPDSKTSTTRLKLLALHSCAYVRTYACTYGMVVIPNEQHVDKTRRIRTFDCQNLVALAQGKILLHPKFLHRTTSKQRC